MFYKNLTFAISLFLLSIMTTPAFACMGALYNGAGKQVETEQFIKTVLSNDIILFGERHGIKAHVLAARCLVSHIVTDRDFSLIMEHLTHEDTLKIDGFRKENPEQADKLGIELKWWERGWPSWSIYLPLIEMVWVSRSPILGGDLSNTAREDKGNLVLNEEFKKALGAKHQFFLHAWQKAMAQAHCGLIDTNRTKQLAIHQIHRDHNMAKTLIETSKNDGIKMLYAGRGHVRKDRALYGFLSKANKEGSAKSYKILSIGAYTQPVYEALKQSEHQKFDYIWVVGKEPLNNACANLSEQKE